MVQYILTGFTHENGFRVFAFEGVREDRARTEYKVKADLTLARKYGIRVQELPLLCRRILAERGENDPQRSLTYTESDMRLNADASAALVAAAQAKKAPRRPPQGNLGAAWRAPQR